MTLHYMFKSETTDYVQVFFQVNCPSCNKTVISPDFDYVTCPECETRIGVNFYVSDFLGTSSVIHLWAPNIGVRDCYRIRFYLNGKDVDQLDQKDLEEVKGDWHWRHVLLKGTEVVFTTETTGGPLTLIEVFNQYRLSKGWEWKMPNSQEEAAAMIQWAVHRPPEPEAGAWWCQDLGQWLRWNGNEWSGDFPAKAVFWFSRTSGKWYRRRVDIDGKWCVLYEDQVPHSWRERVSTPWQEKPRGAVPLAKVDAPPPARHPYLTACLLVLGLIFSVGGIVLSRQGAKQTQPPDELKEFNYEEGIQFAKSQLAKHGLKVDFSGAMYRKGFKEQYETGQWHGARYKELVLHKGEPDAGNFLEHIQKGDAKQNISVNGKEDPDDLAYRLGLLLGYRKGVYDSCGVTLSRKGVINPWKK